MDDLSQGCPTCKGDGRTTDTTTPRDSALGWMLAKGIAEEGNHEHHATDGVNPMRHTRRGAGSGPDVEAEDVNQT